MTVLKAGTIKRLHVNRAMIAADKKSGERSPALTVQTSKGAYRGTRVRVYGASVFVYRPGRPLSCGARAWVETHALVEVEK